MPRPRKTESPYSAEFARKLKEARIQKNYSPTELAALSGISYPHYQQIESGKSDPSIFVAARLAFNLDITLDSLVNHVYKAKESWSTYKDGQKK